jgi:hypothetical protein
MAVLACCVLAVACGDDDGSTVGDAAPPTDGSPQVDAGPGVDSGPRVDAAPPVGELTGALRVNHLGWRPGDRKVAVLLGTGDVAVELRRVTDGEVVGTYTASGLSTDEDSGDSHATVDLSAWTTPGDYYLLVPTLDVRSYAFRIGADVYDIAGAAAAKSFYYQRCNHERVLPHASDALLGYPGIGGQWVDGACHETDHAAPAGPGSADHGALDVHGGWHDAGDYQKTLWGRGVVELLFAYEVNPDAWTDGQLNLPESGNGIPDLLDEARWELDFYVRMQRPDGHFMSSAKGRGPDTGGISSPPSASNEGRVYFDCTSPSGDGWSGGGVTLAAATGHATLALAHAAIVFDAIGQAVVADGYAVAAESGWNWLAGQGLTGDEDRLKAAAAAAIHRMDPTLTSAGTFAEGFGWATEDGLHPYSMTPGHLVLSAGAWHVLLDAAADAGLKATVEGAVVDTLVDPAFDQEGAYGGMFGGPGNGWDWSWGSNTTQSAYGANLMMARHLGVLGSHSADELLVRAQKHLHFMLGLNPLSMVYLTNMAAYGAEHSSFQIYHAWFSHTGGDGDHGNADYNGKPTAVDEPLYPYHPDDDQTSTYGPAPGLVPGGPNFYYSCSYDLPNREYPAYAYRDFSVSCDWDGSQCLACAWEISEPMNAYEGPFVLLASFMME